jgi:hypothetical protein
VSDVDLWLPGAQPGLCPAKGVHRGPEGPNEDLSQCFWCGSVSYAMRPWGETMGWHADDCSLPIWHEGHCAPGGNGHPAAPTIRGYWPSDPRSPDFKADR